MSAKTIKSALGQLQDDPENEAAWSELTEGVTGDSGMSAEELSKLLEAARVAHASRREHRATARLLELEAAVAKGTPREVELIADRARVLDEDLVDDEGATAAYARLLELSPNDTRAQEAIETGAAKRAKWSEIVERYVLEAKSTSEPSFKSSLLVGAAEAAYRHGRAALASSKEKGWKKKTEALVSEVIDRLNEALAIDPKNRRAATLLEHVYREEGRWEEVATMLEGGAGEAPSKEEKVAGYLRLARVLRKKLNAPERAVAAYERALDLSPGHPEATGALVEFFNERQMWDHLVALYDEQLKSGAVRAGQEAGIVLQIAMVHWRMRNRPDAAEPYFERLRKMEPAHPGMLAFFREHCTAKGEHARLATVLTDASRTMPDGPQRTAVVAEIAKLAEEGANAQKAIEQWRAVLRQDPSSKDAREALKRLYRATAQWNALTDLLRQELEKVGQDDAAGRLPILREIATVYRDHVKSDSAMVTVLAQITALDPKDTSALRELARVYENLQRWRDLLATQARLAELESDTGVKAELYRQVARRWLDQFSNVQNAVEAYEKLHAADPSDREAIEKLKELYQKRRAYKPLYELYDQQAKAMSEGAERRELLLEMAKMAAERLDRGADAVRLYKEVLAEDPQAQGALDALEKQAERDKDYATLAEVLERRVETAGDDNARLNVLQKLGGVYADRLHDHAGAMKAWRRVLAISPGHGKAMRVLRDSLLAVGDFDALTDLYATTKDWEGLVEVVSGAADKATSPEQKIALSFRAADIYENKIGSKERAFRAYERVLSVRPDDPRAAAALVPLYEKDEKWNRLPALYEVLLAHAEETSDKLALLEKLVQVSGHHLQDRAAAFHHAKRSYELAPEEPDALAKLERAARAGGQAAAFVDVLAARAKSKKLKKEEKRQLRAKIAEVSAKELGKIDEAVASYKALIEEDEKDEEAVQSLDRILRAGGRSEDLRWLFEVRVSRANTAAKIDLLSGWAELEEETFADPKAAAALYRRILEIVPQHGKSLRSLARLLRGAGDAEGAAEVLERDRDQREGADRAAREVELARLYMSQLKRPNDALSAAKRAFEIAPNDPQALAVVEELLTVGETRARAAVMLEQAYSETGNAQRQADVLEVLVAAAAAREDRLALYNTLADVNESKLGNAGVAFDVIARAAAEYPTELPLWDRLAVLASKSHKTQSFVDAIVAALPATGESNLPERVELDLAERAATLFDEKLGDIDRARPYLERILARDPGNDRAFHRLKQILTTREQWGELEAMYERAVAAATDSTRQAELLSEAALVAEEITNERAKAIHYYERILDIAPLHEQALRSLDSLYASESRWESLAKLLARRLPSASAEDALTLKLRLGALHLIRLADPQVALGHLEDVLRETPNSGEARRLVEQILNEPRLRARAAVCLEAVYTERDEVNDLVRVLEIRLEFAAETTERRELLRRIAELRDERMHDDASAFDAFARLLPLDPEDARARARTLEIARRLGAFERAASVLSEAAKAATTAIARAEILTEVAKIAEDSLNDTARAEALYSEVLGIAPDDAQIALPATKSLERIYAAAGKSADLARILKIEVKLEDNATVRREIYGRLGELSESVLDDKAAAVEAWRARLDDDPTDEQALAALDRLYEQAQDWRALVEVLRARERQANDKGARKMLMMRIASTLSDRLTDVPEAILAYRAVVDEFGADRGVLAALATLYEIADRWQDLAETLEADLALAETPVERIAVLTRLGAVRREKQHDVDGAIEAYRQALGNDPRHEPSRAALESIIDERSGVSPDARSEAAAILRPLYEADGAHAKLLRVLDIEVGHADNVGEKLAVLTQATAVAEGPLGDPARALAYASRGLRESVQEPDLPTWLERVERLTSVTGKYAELVDLLKTVAPEILDGELQLEVTRKVAELARTRLGDLELARSYYVRALDQKSDDRRALEALESLYEETKDARALLDIVKRRVDVAENDHEKKALLFKEARLCDETLGDPRAAIGVYEQILEIGLDPHAVAGLERLYASTERWEDLVALYERQLSQEGLSAGRKAELHHALGDVLEKRLREIDRAFDEYEAALKLDPQHAATVASLETLMGDRAQATRAAEMLEAVYLIRLDWRRVMKTIEARLDASEDPEERRQLLRRLAKLHEEQEENYREALEMSAKLLAEDVTDESTWSELERLARVANAEGRLAEIYAAELEKIASDEPATAKLAYRAGELYESQKDAERALRFYRRAHAFDPEAEKKAFDAIDRLLRQANRPAERVALYRAALDYRSDPQDRLKTLLTIGQIEEEELKDDAAAIETHKQALDTEEADVRALEALSRLYARAERWRELADHVRRRAEQSALPEDEAKFRLDLGRLLQDKLGDANGAIDEYAAVVDLLGGVRAGASALAIAALEQMVHAPEHKARVVDILRPIYEKSDDWKSLVQVNGERLALAGDAGEKVGILRETAKLWEDRGGDPGRAFEAMRDAFVLDPDDGAAREELDRLAAMTARWDGLADAYEQAIAKSEGMTQRELLLALARLHDKRRDDPRRALDAYDRLFKLDETDLAPLEEMDALATLLSDWSTLVRVLAKKAELLVDDESRASTWRRIGEARRDMLDDASGAIDAYERALELEPDSAFTVDNLMALYEAKNDAARLVTLYRRRVELCGDDEQSGDRPLKLQLLLDAATRYETGLGDRREAIEALNDALLVAPGNDDVLRRLDALFVAEKMWPELLDNLRLQATAAADPAARRALRKRIGDLLARELEDPSQALSSYREVLADGYEEATAGAVRAIGEDRDELRSEAADILEPVLRAAGKHAELADVLEMRLRAQSEANDRAKTLHAIAVVAESNLGDSRRAEQALLRAIAEEPSDAALHSEIERLADQLGRDGWQRYADALADRASAIFDAQITTDLFVRLGRVAETKLNDDARASKAYAQAAERAGDSPAILEALDRLLARLGETRALAEVIERRIASESDGDRQAELYHRLASLQIEAFDDKARGLTTLRIALERVPSHEKSREAIERLLEDDALFEEAFEALEGVYRSLGQNEGLARIYERKVARMRSSHDKTRARIELAKVLEDDVKDAARAQRVIESALADEPADEDVLAELERLAAVTSGWREAADALARALGGSHDVPRATLAELWVRLAEWRREKLEDARGAEDAYTSALALDAENIEVLRAIEALRRAPGRERDLVATLRARAKLETDYEAKRGILREAKELAETTLADAALAESVLRDLLAENDADQWALEELARVREAAGDHGELVTLLLKRAETTPDGGLALDLKHRAAQVLTDKTGETTRAISLYEEILEGEPSDARAATALRALYASSELNRDLAKLLTRLIDVATSASARAELRLDLARVQAEKFKADDDAVDTLRAILDEEPTHEGAVLALSQLYERTGKDAELAELLRTQLDAAKERGDTAAELTILVRLGSMYETRLDDAGAAQDAYERVLERDPLHHGALEAIARLGEKRGAWEKAASALEKLAVASANGNSVGYALRLAAAREQLGDADGIEAALTRALAVDESNHEVRERLKALYEKRRKWAELAQMLVRDAELIAAAHPEIIPVQPPPPVIGGSAASIAPGARTSLMPGAGSMAPPAASLPPPAVPAPLVDQAKLLRRAAQIHIEQRNEPNDAIPILERATQVVPTDRDLLLYLCDAYSAAGRGRDAAAALERVIASFGARRSKELSLYHHRLGKALAQLGDKDVALAQFDMAFKIDPGSVGVLRDLGVLAFENNDLDRAQKTFRALLLQRLDANAGISKGEVFYYLGEISAKQGDKTKAVQMFERAIENEPTLDKAKAKLSELKG